MTNPQRSCEHAQRIRREIKEKERQSRHRAGLGVFLIQDLFFVIEIYSIRPLFFSRISTSVPLTFLRRTFNASFSAKESFTSVIGFLSIA